MMAPTTEFLFGNSGLKDDAAMTDPAVGPRTKPDPLEACMWLTLAVERAGPGKLHDRASVNLTNAPIPLSPDQIREAQRRAEKYRANWAAHPR